MHYFHLLFINSAEPNTIGVLFALEDAQQTEQKYYFFQLFDCILLTLPRQTDGGGKSSAETVADLAADILVKFPPLFDLESVIEKYPVLYSESMNTVLRQELIRFNRLTEVVVSTLKNIQKAIKVTPF